MNKTILFNSSLIIKLDQKIEMIKKIVLNTTKNLYDGRELVINAFKSGLISLKSTTGTGRKILISKQMLQRLTIALQK